MMEKLRIPLALTTIILLLLAACSPAAQPAPGAPAAPAVAPKAPAPAAKPAEPPKETAKLPKRGGNFVYAGAATTDPVGWAPTLEGGHAGKMIWKALSCNLVKLDNRPGHPSAATEIVPELAESWENPTPPKYIFHLRKGVKTQTGKEVTAADIKWTADLLKEKVPNDLRGWWGDVDPDKGIEIPDPYTIVFNLPSPDADFLVSMGGAYVFTYFNTKAAPTEDPKWQKWGGFYKGLENIDGCGAWKGVQYQATSHIIFERRNDYFELGKDGKPLPYLDRVELRYIFDFSALIASLRAGQIMAIPEWPTLPLKLVEQVAKDDPGIRLSYVPGPRAWKFSYDLYTPPFNDIRVRRAMNMAIDRKKWIQSQFNGRAKNIYGVYPVMGEWALSTDDMGDGPNDPGHWWRYHPDEARALLKEAGYTNGFEFPFRTSEPTGAVPFIELFAGIMKDELKITTKITPIEYAALGRSGIPDNGLTTGYLLRPELKSFVWVLQHPALQRDSGHGNRSYFPPDMPMVKEYKALIEKQQQTLDPKERLKLVHEMQRMGANNMFYLYFPVEDLGRLQHSFVKDFEPYATYNLGELIYTWLDK